jgi:NTP pyrophosphatase (non-canonical NTP hydrolase)
MQAEKNAERITALEAELERRATSHPADRYDASAERAASRKTYANSVEALEEFDVCCPGKDFGTIPDAPGNRKARLEKLMAMNAIEDDEVEPLITFAEYQFGAKKTAIYNQDARVLYPALGLAGEVGEVAEKVLAMAAHAGKAANQVKKIIRDDDCECDTDRKHEIGKEIGGVLWYCAAVCSDLGLDMGEIAKGNLGVLADRQKRGVIQGSGDNR